MTLVKRRGFLRVALVTGALANHCLSTPSPLTGRWCTVTVLLHADAEGDAVEEVPQRRRRDPRPSFSSSESDSRSPPTVVRA